MNKSRFVFLSIFFFFFSTSFSFAEFQKECFLGRAEMSTDMFAPNSVYKIISNAKPLLITQGEEDLSYKYYLTDKNQFSYTLKNYSGPLDILSDNIGTAYQLDTNITKTLEIHFLKGVKNGSLFFDYKAQNYYPKYFVKINNVYTEVTLFTLHDYDFSDLKIEFVPKNSSALIAEKILIYELQMSNYSYTTLIKTGESTAPITLYSDYTCLGNSNFFQYQKGVYSIDISTQSIALDFKVNPDYITVPNIDTDKDGVQDSMDNCKINYNPDQRDTNANGKGDMCDDDDFDGIIGEKDNCIFVSNVDQKDINQNGVGDVCEFDKDKDGIFDSLDNCITQSNPDQTDSDHDGIGDTCDNCDRYNPTQRDENQNGVGDTCEQINKDLIENDDDGDGVHNSTDNCKNIPNPNQRDIDLDGIGDVCDNCLNLQNHDQLDSDENNIGDMCEDSDKDGLDGYLDNCKNIANADQKDSDNDGIGDLCEDEDYDKILLVSDNCPYSYNPDQKDIDKDGIGDVCDADDGRFIESNKGFFIALLVLIVVTFVGAIYFMVKKINKI